MIGRRLGRYELTAELGRGAMGEVYRARDESLERDVAVKVLPREVADDVELLERFRSEARAVARLAHPNILTVHDVGETDGVPYLVTELLDGETLAERLSRGALAWRRAVEMAVQIAAGLAAAHARGVVHRDLKPSNVFVTTDGVVKILDFGLAKLFEAHPETGAAVEEAATLPGLVMGTPGYMAPEQVHGFPVDERTDLFALGVVLCEMLTGRKTFHGDSRAELLAAVLRDEPPELPAGAPFVLAGIVRRCLEKEADDRFGAARDLSFALDAVLAEPAGGPDGATAGSLRSQPPTVGVLLFRDLSGSRDSDDLAVGLTDAIVTELAGLSGLVVRPTAASLRVAEEAPEAAGGTLGVSAVVDGTFQRAGSRLRITVQLVDVGAGASLWADKIEVRLDDLFAVQDAVARKVAEALEIRLTPEEERGLARTPDGGVGEAYLRGRAHLLRETAPNTYAAIEWFEQAVAEAPGSARAHAGLADAFTRLAFTFEPGGGWYEKATEECRRALALDPDLPEARYVNTRLLWSPDGGFDHAGALRELAVALAGRPNFEPACERLGTILFHVGFLEEGARWLARALEIAPGDMVTYSHLGLARYYQLRFDEALEISRTAARRSPTAWSRCLAALACVQLDRLQEAERELEKGRRQFPDNAFFHSIAALVAARRGERGRAEAEIERTKRFEGFGHYHHARHDVACAWAQLGEPERALDWLESAAGDGFPCASFFAVDPLLEPLATDARFATLLDRLRAETDDLGQLYAGLFDRSVPREVGHASFEGEPVAPAVETPPARAVAVLPFTDLSAEGDQQYFCDGVADEIITELAALPDLRVVSRASSFLYRERTIDLREIGARLGAAVVLDGSVRKAGGRLRVTAQLIDAETGYSLWTDRYDRDLEDVFAIQDEIAAATAEALHGALVGPAAAQTPAAPTRVEAYDSYLRGRHDFYRGGRGLTVAARQMFRRALEVDPAYAAAWAGLADACAFLFLYYEPEIANRAEAEEASRRAVAVAPDLGEAHASLGLALSLSGRYEEAMAALGRAMELHPRLFEARYLSARVALASGDIERATELLEQAAVIRPEEIQVAALLARVLRELGRRDDALTASRRTLDLADHIIAMSDGDARVLANKAGALVDLGRREEGLQWAERAAAVGSGDAMPYYAAAAFARAGADDRALEVLGETIRAGWSHWDWLRHDSDFDRLREDARFVTLLPADAPAAGPP